MIRLLEFADVINKFDFIDNIIQYADRQRFEISVCVRSEDNNIARPEFPEGTKYAYLAGNSRKDAVATAWKLSRLLRDWKIDILHAHHFEQAIVGWLATRFYPRTKLIIGRHYSDAIYRNPSQLKRRGLLAIEQKINRDAERIIVPSQMIRDLLIRRQGIPEEKIDLVHYGFVTEKYSEPKENEIAAIKKEFGLKENFVIANFSRFHEEKGHRFLLDAAAKLKQTLPNLCLILVGDGPEKANIEHKIKENDLNNTVILAGWRKDAMSIMAAADAVVQSTLQEAFSQVMCEAMWMKRPLIMTDVSGARDVIEDGVNGKLVPKGDADAIAKAILELASDEGLRQRLGENARRFVEDNLTVDKQIPKYEAAFERVVAGR